MASDEMKIRRDKLNRLREIGMAAYAARYTRSHSLAEAQELADGTSEVRLAGRVVAIRKFGKLLFGHLMDGSGRLQFALEKGKLGEHYRHFAEIVDVGDFVGIEGEIFTTRTGEKTIGAEHWSLLSKALRPLPEKFHGLVDTEQRLRKRYLDLVMSPETMSRFKKRTAIIKSIRGFLDDHGFLEIDTPVLTNRASGALATPFTTHYSALDIDVFMRIAPETYLKRAIAGGFDRVYEFARCFRNEGIDPSHLPDFTMLEYYCSYWDFVENMDFTEKLLQHLLREIEGSLELTYDGHPISFEGKWPRISFRDLIRRDCGIDIDRHPSKEELLEVVKAEGITLDEDTEGIGRGTLVDLLYKKVSRQKIIDPVFVIHHPIDLSPLARKSDDNPQVADRFQLVINGWEIVNAYSELIDPLDQAERFREQAALRAAGEKDAMDMDRDFLTCMEYGMPPISGWGMGVDRLVALMTDVPNLREVVLFPLMRPEA